MKRILFTLVLLFAIGLSACKKNGAQPDIKAYDQQQIQNYIAANGLTGMQEAQDTTGIWYKIISPGTGKPEDTLGYPTYISYVYTQKSFDNKYILTDTIADHFYGNLGHTAPVGLMLALHNIAKYKGCKIRLLIPSHIAYGVNGAGQGSSTVTNGRIAGNQCLDYTINVISDQVAYDQMVIANYMAANNLTGYTKTADGLWYKITTAPTGTDKIGINSDITLNYTGQMLNGTVFDNLYATTATNFGDISTLVTGFQEGLMILGKSNGSISMIIPSSIGYGTTSTGAANTTIPANSCLRFDVTVTTVTN